MTFHSARTKVLKIGIPLLLLSVTMLLHWLAHTSKWNLQMKQQCCRECSLHGGIYYWQKHWGCCNEGLDAHSGMEFQKPWSKPPCVSELFVAAEPSQASNCVHKTRNSFAWSAAAAERDHAWTSFSARSTVKENDEHETKTSHMSSLYTDVQGRVS